MKGGVAARRRARAGNDPICKALLPTHLDDTLYRFIAESFQCFYGFRNHNPLQIRFNQPIEPGHDPNSLATASNRHGGSNAPPQRRRGAPAAHAGGTLRVWERRYGLTQSTLSPGGQRLYSADDVRRLALLKQLVDLGHAIGSLAPLDLPQLQRGQRRTARLLAAGRGSFAGPLRDSLRTRRLVRRHPVAPTAGLLPPLIHRLPMSGGPAHATYALSPRQHCRTRSARR